MAYVLSVYLCFTLYTSPYDPEPIIPRFVNFEPINDEPDPLIIFRGTDFCCIFLFSLIILIIIKAKITKL